MRCSSLTLNPSEQSQPKKSTIKSLGKGYMRGIILGMLAEHPRYGYEILQAISEASDGWRPSPGTIYPMLHHLNEQGLISKTVQEKKGRRRIIYKLRAKGKVHLEHDARQHGHFVAIMRKILGKHGGPHFPGSPAFNIDHILQRLRHAKLLLKEASMLSDEQASYPDHGISLLQNRLQLLEDHQKALHNAIRQVKMKIQELERKIPNLAST